MLSKERAPWRAVATRVALYGSLPLLLWGAWRLRARLEARAAAAQDAAPPAVRSLEGSLESRTIYEVLRRTGAGTTEAGKVSTALRHVVNPRRLGPDARWAVAYSSAGALLHLTLYAGAERHLVVLGADGRARASSARLAVISEGKSAAGAVQGSLWASMESAGVPAETILLFADTFQWTVDFLTETQDGDRFAVLWEQRRTPDGRSQGRRVQAALYSGRVTGRKVGLLFDGAYFDEQGDSLKRRFLRAPIKFARVSSGFSLSRRHPILRIHRPHHGTDYAAPIGTPVSTVAEGTVVSAGWHGGFGRAVAVRHDSTYTSLYGHLSRIAARVRAGTKVHQGQVLGFVGKSGLATGPHLHFQMEKNGRWVDYLKLDLPFASSVARGRRPAFQSQRARALAELEGLLARVPPGRR